MMGFIDAVNNMFNGKRMIRPKWNGYYLIILDGQNFIWIISKDNVGNANVNIYTASIEDIQATDWIIKPN